MLRSLAFFLLTLYVLPVQTHAQPHKTQKATEGDKPATPAPPALVTKQDDSPDLQAKPDAHVKADVRVISTPPKDRYDRAVFWANIILTSVGLGGIVVATFTLCRIHNQAVEMRRQRILMERTLLTVRRQGEIMDRQVTESKIASDKSYELSADTAKRQLRAYLGVSHAVATITPQGEIGARVDIENSGNTPAYSVRSWSHAIIAPYPPAGILKPPAPGSMRQGVSIIPSKREQYLPAKPFPAAPDGEKILELLKYPDVAYFVHGRVEYLDVFKDAHFVNFRLIIGGPATYGFSKDNDGNYVAKLSMDTEGNETD